MFLGLDLGTSNVKTLIVDRDASIVAQGSAPVARSETPDGGVTQNLDQIWEATCQAIAQAAGQTNASRIEAVGVCSQGGAIQLLGPADKLLGPVISWLDTRGRPFARQLEDQWGEQYFVEHTGCNFCSTALGQIVRLQQESPERFKAAESIGWVGDLIVGRLCGRRAHDPTNLSLAMLYNPALATADPDLRGRLKIDDKRLPDLLPATKPAGRLRADVARRTGLPEGIAVSAAMHDQYAAAIGAGVVDEGDILVGTGTAWVLLAVTGRLAPPVVKRTFVCAHPVAGRFGQLFSMGNAGAIIQSALEATGNRDLDQASLDELLESIPSGSGGLCFEPAYNGENSIKETTGSDSANPLAAGTFSGGDPSRSDGYLLRAVFEGLARKLAEHLSWFAQAGLPVERVVLTGPAAGGRVLPKMISDATGRPVARVNHPAVGALGAAAVARVLVDTNADLREVARSVQNALKE